MVVTVVVTVSVTVSVTVVVVVVVAVVVVARCWLWLPVLDVIVELGVRSPVTFATAAVATSLLHWGSQRPSCPLPL